MKKVALLTLAILIPHLVLAYSYTTEARQTANVIAVATESYYEEHGQLPDNWEEITMYMDGSDIDQLFPYVIPSKRFAFVTEPVYITYHNDSKARVVMLMRSRMRDIRLSQLFMGIRKIGLTRPGRYLILQYENGDTGVRFVHEPDVRKTFRDAGVALPTADNLPPFPHVREYHRNRIFFWFAATLILSALVYATSAFLKRKKNFTG